MVILSLMHASEDRYKVIVNGQKIKLSARDGDCFENKRYSADLTAQRAMDIVIKRRTVSCILCFFANVAALFTIGRGSEWEPIRNVICFAVENPDEADGGIDVIIYRSAINRNSVKVSDKLKLRKYGLTA